MDVTVGGASKDAPSDPEEHKSIRNSTRDPTQGLANLTVPTYKRLGHIRNRVQCHGTELREWCELHRCLSRPWRHHNSRQRTRRIRGLRGHYGREAAWKERNSVRKNCHHRKILISSNGNSSVSLMDNPDPSPSPVDKAAENFRYYASTVYPGRSPLYVSLAMRVAEDPELLTIAAKAWEKNALPNLFFSAVHFLLLKGEHHQLAAFYPSLNNNSKHYDFAYPYFRSFVLEHKNEIEGIITARFVQTNEVGRCAILVPAFGLVARHAKNRPLALIEIGSSAGLTLLWDRYYYQYDNSLRCGDPKSPVKVECLLRGGKRPPVPKRFPEIASRLGVDLNPVDLNNPENVQWLQALVWPEHQKRANQLELATQVASDDPPQIIRGDALEIMPSLINLVQGDSQLCIFHSFTLSLANGEPRKRLEQMLAKASEVRNLFHISFEWPRNSETPLLSLASLNSGEVIERILARCNAHGEWIEWLENPY